MQLSATGKLIKKLLALGRSQGGYLVIENVIGEWSIEIYIARENLTPLQESKYLNLGGHYKVRVDPPHVIPGLKHLHGYAAKTQIFAMNIDGSGPTSSQTVFENCCLTFVFQRTILSSG